MIESSLILVESKPLISIVMPLYNKENEVRRAIDSVLAQTFTDFELTVVNDGSTDNGSDIVRSIKDDRIRVIDLENSGVSVARNNGIEESRSDLIAFLDADDEWKATFLETIIKLKQQFHKCSVFATGYSYLHQDGTKTNPIINGLPPHPWHGVIEHYFHIASISDPPLCSSATAVTKEALANVKGFPVGIKSGEDLLTWAKLAVKYHIAYDTTSLALFNQRSSAHEKPTRTPDFPDNVGMSLKKLLDEVQPSYRTGLKHYIAMWHKNRASMYLRLCQRLKALKEVVLMGYYHLDKKFFLYIVCLLLPFSLIQQLILLRSKNRR